MLRPVRMMLMLLLWALAAAPAHAQSISFDGEWPRYQVENGTVSMALPPDWVSQADGNDRVVGTSADSLMVIGFQVVAFEPAASEQAFFDSSCEAANYSTPAATVREIAPITDHPVGGSGACRVLVEQVENDLHTWYVIYWFRYGDGAAGLNITGVIDAGYPGRIEDAITLVDRAAGTLRVDAQTLDESTWTWYGSGSQQMWINAPADWSQLESENADALLVQSPDGTASVSASSFTLDVEAPDLTSYEQSIRDGYAETGELLGMQMVDAPFGRAYRLTGLTLPNSEGIAYRQVQYVFLRGQQIFVLIESVDSTLPSANDLLLEWIASSFTLLPVPAAAA